jgi:hypothetical protein
MRRRQHFLQASVVFSFHAPPGYLDNGADNKDVIVTVGYQNGYL